MNRSEGKMLLTLVFTWATWDEALGFLHAFGSSKYRANRMPGSDLFHEEVPEAFITRVFDVMRRASRHMFFVLTKRSERLRDMASRLPWPDHLWMGVSVERGDYAYRLDHLRQTPAKVKVAVFEPLLGPVPSLNLKDIHWVIAGGETGPEARPMQEAWVADLRDQCLAASVPFYFKQWGSAAPGRRGCLLQGRTWDEMPQAWRDDSMENGLLFES
jgi:protein gp37